MGKVIKLGLSDKIATYSLGRTPRTMCEGKTWERKQLQVICKKDIAGVIVMITGRHSTTTMMLPNRGSSSVGITWAKGSSHCD